MKDKKKRMYFDFDIDVAIGFKIAIYRGTDVYHSVISIMCFNFYIYWYRKGVL